MFSIVRTFQILCLPLKLSSLSVMDISIAECMVMFKWFFDLSFECLQKCFTTEGFLTQCLPPQDQ